jgi:glucose/arabinose dehydrogenase
MPPRSSGVRSALRLGAAVAAVAATFAAARRSEPDAPQPLEESAVPIVALEPIADGLGSITAITNAGDDRLFVTSQEGRVWIVSGGGVLPTPFLDIQGIVNSGGERGLLSTAFHPHYAQNGFFFVYYTNGAGDIEIARFERSAGDPNAADTASRVVLLTIPHPVNANHNGGQLQFGPDGYLYIGTGDGGAANDPPCNAQRDDVLLGKLLRIDVDQNVASPPFYGIPADNPFAAPGGPRDEIWAKGLRNPWRFSFDRVTGDLWIGDVGQGDREEIDFQPRASHGGENYGWKVMEGTQCDSASACPANTPPCNSPEFVRPVYEYTHSEGCAVTGGYLYRGARVSTLVGRYVYGDYCSGRMWANGDRLLSMATQLSTFGEDKEGELYVGTQDGRIQRFFDPTPPPPTATTTRTATPPQRVVVPLPHRFVTPRTIDRER